MAVEYRITLDDEHAFNYKVQIERDVLVTDRGGMAADWVRLEYHKCTNCPLNSSEHATCPAAVDLKTVVEDFKGLPAFRKAWCHVRTEEREYSKLVNLEVALRSLLGVIMATSGCPVLNRLKPMARSHLPFASDSEFVLRTVSMYVLRELFKHREGRAADWDLTALTQDFSQLQLVNQALWHRIHDVCAGDTNLKAFLSFFSMSSSMTYSLDAQLEKVRSLVMEQENMLSF
jgi:hypothetical protein